MKYDRLTSPTALSDALSKLTKRVSRIETKGTGSISFIDANSGEETIIGTLPDGSTGVEQFIGDTTPPPVATMPMVSATPGSFIVTWDGLFVNGAEKPRDFVHVNVVGHKMDGSSTVLSTVVGVIRLSSEAVNVSTDIAVAGESWQFSLESEDYNGNTAAEGIRSNSLVMIDSISSVDVAWNDMKDDIATAQTAASTAQTAASTAQTKADQASSDALAASGIANSKGKVLTQSNTPDIADQNANTLWIDTTGGANTPKKWNSISALWVAVTDKTAIDAATAAANAQTKADQAFNNAASASTAAGNAQTSADSKNRVWYQTEAPAGTGHKTGDTWFDTNDGNKVYVWNGSIWADARDTGIASAQSTASSALTSANGKNKTYYQTSMPTGGTYILGDTWFDTDDGYKIYVHNGTTFVASQDAAIGTAQSTATTANSTANTALSTANNKTKTYFQTAQPSLTGNTVGDTWFDTDDSNKVYVWNGSAWATARDAGIASASNAAATAQQAANDALTAAQAAQAVADGAIRTFYQSGAPTGLNNTTNIGDLWFDTDDGQAYRWNGTAWTIIEDNSIAAALAAAQNAQTTADGKITSYYQPGQPAVGEVGDLWFDTDDKNKPYYCSSISPLTWSVVRDGTIADAQSTANTALTSANGKNVTYYQTTMPTGGTYIKGDTWFDTDDGNKIYVHNGTTFVVAQDTAITTAQNTANAKTKTYFQTAQPGLVGNTTGDIWFDTDDGNKPYVWNGSAWTVAQDATIAAADSKASTALTSANGKNKIYYQTAMPTGGTYIAGDTWFDTDDGNKIYVHNGTTFIASQLGTNAIANLAITDAQIASATISSAKIAALDAAKITSGTIDANRIAAGSISAAKLQIGDFENLATINEVNGITVSANGQTQIVGGYNTKVNDADAYFMFKDRTGPVPFLPGDKLRISFVAKATAATTVTPALWAYDATGSNYSSSAPSQNVGTTDTNISTIITVGSWATPAKEWLIGINGSANKGLQIKNVVIRRMNGGELLVDGSITAGSAIIANGAIGNAQIANLAVDAAKIDDLAVTSAKIDDLAVTNAKIANATIQSAKISSVDAGTITVGTLDANRIGADTITATHIASNAITANELAANSITAAKGQISDLAVITAKIADVAITNAKIADLAVTNAKIANATIQAAKIGSVDAGTITVGQLTAVQIASGAITTTHMTSGTIDAGVLTAGSITAPKIASKSITVDKLLVTSTENIIQEADFGGGGASWELPTNFTVNPTAGRNSLGAMVITNTATVQTSYSAVGVPTKVPIEYYSDGGNSYRLSAWVNSSVTVPTSGAYISARFRSSTGTTTIQNVYYTTGTPAALATIPANTWTEITGVVTAPANTLSVSFSINSAASLSTGTIKFDSVGAIRASDGQLIVDGAIDGKTITGATIQTAATGPRIVLDQNALNAWNTAGDNYFSMSDATGVNISSKGKAGYSVNRTNYCTNPSMTVNSTGWTAPTGQTAVRDATIGYVGTSSLKVTNTVTADRTTSRLETTPSFSNVRFSVYVRHNAAAAKTITAKLHYVDSANGPLATTNGTATSVAANTWTRLSVTTTAGAPSGTANIRLEVVGTSFTSTEIMYIDAAMMEATLYALPTLGAYFDGDTTDTTTYVYNWGTGSSLNVSYEQTYKDVKIKSGGNSIVVPNASASNLAPGIGFIPTTPYAQTAGLFSSDGQTVSLIEGGGDPQLARIDVGTQEIDMFGPAATNIRSGGGINITPGGGGGMFVNGNVDILGTLNGVSLDPIFDETDASHTQFTWLNGFTHFGSGYGNMQLKEIMPGVVLMEGMAKYTTTRTDGMQIGTIPTQFRPNRNHNLPCVIRTGTVSQLNEPGLLSINTAGVVSLYGNMGNMSYAVISVTYFLYSP